MRNLPLYETERVHTIEKIDPKAYNKYCDTCKTIDNPTGFKCISPSATKSKNYILVVVDSPTAVEEHAGTSSRIKLIQGMVENAKKDTNYETHAVVIDYAVKCKSRVIENSEVDNCRKYLKHSINKYKPSIIITFGGHATEAVIDRKGLHLSTSGGYSWVHVDKEPTPVIMTMAPYVMANKFDAMLCVKQIRALLVEGFPFNEPYNLKFNIVETEEDAECATDKLLEHKFVTFDVETSGKAYNDNFEIVTLAMSGSGSDDVYVWDKKACASKDISRHAVKLITDKRIGKVGHNIKYEYAAVQSFFGVKIENIYSDTQIQRKLLLTESGAALDQVSEFVGMGGYKKEFDKILKPHLGRIRKARANHKQQTLGLMNERFFYDALEDKDTDAKTYAYALVSDESLARYCARDTVATNRAATFMDKELNKNPTIKYAWNSVVRESIGAMAQIEAWGVKADTNAIKIFAKYIDNAQTGIENKLKTFGDFNPSSNAQVAEMLYTNLKMPILATTKGGAPSCDKKTLVELNKVSPSPILDYLIEYSRISKLNSGYAKSLPRFIRSDGRIHANYKIDGARSGRMSCSEPGLQTIPRAGSTETTMLKNCFYAGAGRSLIQLDYSQLEIRIAAMISGDEKMINLLSSGTDFHMGTAKLICKMMWGIEPEQCGKVQRSAAKAFIFGLLYGKQDSTIANDLNCSIKEAEKLRYAVLGQYVQLASTVSSLNDYTKKHGKAATWWDGKPARIRMLHGIASNNGADRSTALNSSQNTPIQGTAADFCLRSLTELVHCFTTTKTDAKVVLTVHDSIIIDVDNKEVDDIANLAHGVMMSWNSKGVPLEVDVEVGTAWGRLKDYELC